MRARQYDKILAYVRANGYITSYEAYTKCGVTQLAARIKEMRERMGYAITSEWHNDGNHCYKRYFIEEESEE